MSVAKLAASFATKALNFKRTLDADGNAVQGAERVASHNSGLGRVSLLARMDVVNLHEGVELGIEFLDSF